MEVIARFDNATYKIVDYVSESGLTLSITTLHAMKETRGHEHDYPEIYYIVSGAGFMDLGGKEIKLSVRDVVNIPAGVFHKVYNRRNHSLVFSCTYKK